MTALDTQQLTFEEKPLFVPALDEVQKVLEGALSANFEHVEVSIEDCADLTDPRFGLVHSGLSGSPTLLEVGGPPYLLPLVQRDKVYNIKEITEKCMQGQGEIFAVGAGAGPFPIRGTNCEGMFNFAITEDGQFNNGSYTAKVIGPQEECMLERIPADETRIALLLNLYICRGQPGKVLKINVKRRTGELNFIEAIRKGLEQKYQEKCVGMGGTFLLKNGRARQHVMRDFSKTPIQTDEEVNQWLKFYDMPAQLNAVGTLVTHEYDLDLRLQHFHSFSTSNWGGHYHYDTTPETVEYEAYLNLAERIVRVDKPTNTHMMGRD